MALLERLNGLNQELGFAAYTSGTKSTLDVFFITAALMVGKTLSEALPEATAVRPGLMLYGVRPAPQLEADLQPVMTLRASVLSLRSVSAGETVGYGGTFRAPAATRIATAASAFASSFAFS